MQVINIASQGSSGLFPGLFGQQNQAGGGLFGMLMAVLGQNGLQTAAGQNLPTALTGATGTLPKMPISNVADLAAADPQVQADFSAQLMPLLQQLAADPAASAQLKALLAGGEQLDMATFQQRLAGLDDATREEVIGEIAALMQPVLAAQQPVIITPADKGDDVIADGLPAATQPAIATTPQTDLPEQPQDRFLPIAPAQPAPVDGEMNASAQPAPGAPAEPAAAPVQAAAAQPAPPRKTDSKPTADKPVADAAPAPAPDKAGAIDLAAFEQMPPEMRAEIMQRAAKPVHAASTKDAAQQAANAAPVAAAQQAQQPQQTQAANAAQRPASSTQQADAITAASGADSNGDSTLKNLLPDHNTPTAQHAAATAEKAAAQQASFADHLQNVKLNRTGAHMPVADQISVQMNRAISEGKERFTVKLSPGELGRIEVRIEVGADGQMTASFKVDQPATLDLLQRDQRGLERALADAGLKTDSGSLNFNLRGDGNGQQQGQQQAHNNSQDGGHGRPGFSLDGDMAADEAVAAGTMDVTWYVGPDRLDVRV